MTQLALDEKIYRVGAAEVTRIAEYTLDSFTPAALLPEWSAGAASLTDSPLRATTTADGQRLLLSVHAWLVRNRGRTILIDPGVGNDKARPEARYFDRLETSFLDRLAAAGVAPDQVDYVLMTHLHVDHVGWNTRLAGGRWTPTFPNARHLFSRREFEFFTDPANRSERHRTSFRVQQDSVVPVIAAGLAEMIDVDGREAISGFAFHPTPGHSPDHASIVLQSGGERAIFAGDVLHHPAQVERPDLFSIFDSDRQKTLASRHWALDYAATHDATFFSSHFPATSAGRVVRRAERYSWRFL
jgi:glyoxylase-like metal-dependent hydrolase (beta-lactamase superfamily II)